jgi:hypothetical protein
MIFTNSRYANGFFSQSLNKDYSDYNTFVLRNFNSSEEQTYGNYTFTEADRIDILAEIFLGSPKFWHLIMDINPEIPDAFNIKPGTIIRIPYGYPG